MEVSQKLLCLLFLVSVALGVVLGLCYDALKIIRILLGWHHGLPAQTSTKRHRWHDLTGKIFLFVQDLLFGVLCGIVLILILYFVNDGQVRFLAPLGLACGFFAYTFTLGKLICAVSEVIATFIRKIVKCLITAVYKMVSLPVKWLYQLLDHVLLRRIRKSLQQRKEKKQILYTKQQIEQLQKHATKCFGMFDDA